MYLKKLACQLGRMLIGSVIVISVIALVIFLWFKLIEYSQYHVWIQYVIMGFIALIVISGILIKGYEVGSSISRWMGICKRD
jgi:cytochrome b